MAKSLHQALCDAARTAPGVEIEIENLSTDNIELEEFEFDEVIELDRRYTLLSNEASEHIAKCFDGDIDAAAATCSRIVPNFGDKSPTWAIEIFDLARNNWRNSQ